MSLYSRLDRLAADVEKLNKQVTAVSNQPQSQRTSVEGGSIDFNDEDGNLMAVVGGQDDGSNTIRHVDGPTPPVPSGLSAHVDGPIVQVSWDGTFEDGVTATHDWSHLEVVVVGPSNEQLTATINDITGASTSVAATVSGEWTVVARSVSRAEKRSLDGDAGTVTVELVGLSGAINDAIGSANGKNTVTYSEAAPTPADEGIDGDTWFVNSVDTETQIMLITEQWQFLAGVWVQTELDHQVIATIDAGKITVGELDGIRIMGQTISGRQLSGDAIDGKVITGGTYRTTGGTGSWSDDGLFIAQPDGTSMVRFPTDGSPLSLTASDVQIDRASITDLDLSFGSVRSGGQVTLASGVTAPASPPELTTGWQKVTSLPALEERSDVIGLAYWNGHWVRTVNVLGGGVGDRVELYDESTGAFVRSIPLDLDPRNGLTVMGDIVYVFGGDHGAGNAPVIDGYNLVAGVRVSRHSYTRAIQAQNALGNDGTNLIVAGVYNRRLWVHRRNPVTGVQVGSDMLSGELTWPAAHASDLYGVSINAAGTEITVVPGVAARVYTISGGTLTHKAEPANANGLAGWNNPANPLGYVSKVGALGVNVPFIVDGAGDVYEGTQFERDANASACFTWFNGTSETTPSPMLVSSFPARSNPRFSMPARAGMQKRLYFNFGSWNYVTLPEDLTTFSWMNVLDYGLSAGAPPTVNTFPAATPAVLKSNVGGFQVKGDGSGHWGPLTFNADGTMTSTQIPSWVPVTTFLNSASANTFGRAPAYRIWPDGKVEWRGIVSFPATTTTTEFITIPVAARPNTACYFTASGSGARTAALDFCSNEGPTSIRVRFYTANGTLSWFSLDGIYYYKT